MSVLPVGRSSAFDLGLISKDTNIGSIDTHTLFNCFGAAVTCDNDNSVNNNLSINNGTSQSNQPLTCEECFETKLSPEDLQLILSFYGAGSTEDLCPRFVGESAQTFVNDLVLPGLINETEAQALADCLVEAGVLQETPPPEI